MKRHNAKKLYNTAIIKLLATRFYKGEEKYIFSYWTYNKGIFDFYFIPEKDKEKHPLYDSVKMLVNRLYWQQVNDYEDTFALNCAGFDRCENIA